MVIGDQQTEGTRGKDQGILQAPTAVLLTDLILTIHQGQKTTIRPPFLNRKEGAKKRQQQQQEKTQ